MDASELAAPSSASDAGRIDCRHSECRRARGLEASAACQAEAARIRNVAPAGRAAHRIGVILTIPSRRRQPGVGTLV
jgi:hypothetical protein